MIYMRWFVICVILSSSGCAARSSIVKSSEARTIEAMKMDLEIQERDKIFKVYDNYAPNTIILAYEKVYGGTFKVYGGTFDIAKNYLQYNKTTDNPTYDGFWIWLTKNLWYKDWFDKGDEFGVGRWLIDNRFNDREYSEIRKNHELIERMAHAK